jgi:hypothetical protein
MVAGLSLCPSKHNCVRAPTIISVAQASGPPNRLERKPLILFALSYLFGLGWKRLDTAGRVYGGERGSLRVSQSRVLF